MRRIMPLCLTYAVKTESMPPTVLLSRYPRRSSRSFAFWQNPYWIWSHRGDQSNGCIIVILKRSSSTLYLHHQVNLPVWRITCQYLLLIFWLCKRGNEFLTAWKVQISNTEMALIWMCRSWEVGESGGFIKQINNLILAWKLASYYVISTQQDLHGLITEVVLFHLT